MSELWARLRFLFMAIIVYRIGAHIPVPGINPDRLADLFRQNEGTILSLFNMFSGGALERMSIFALGIMPYISASIIMQLMTAVSPQLEQLKKEGEAGRRKISQYTRYGTVILALVQAIGMSIGLANRGVAFSAGLSLCCRRCHLRGRRDVHDVAGRADHRARCGQRYLDVDLRRYRCRSSESNRAVFRVCAYRRYQHLRPGRYRFAGSSDYRLRGVH